jgi:putative membrane protein
MTNLSLPDAALTINLTLAAFTMTLSVSMKALILLVVLATIGAVSAFTTDPGQGKFGAPHAVLRHKFPVRDSREPSLLSLCAEIPRSGSLAEAPEDQEQADIRYGEDSRKYRRTVFTHKDWIKHRSSDRLFRNLSSIFQSGIVRQLFEEISLVAGIATAVVVWNDILVPRYGVPVLCLPTAPFTLSSPALGLLLVFRTNASYQRWLEARTRWGTIITQSRNVVRMGSTWTEDPEALDQLVLAAWLFPRAIMNKLSGTDDDDDFQEELHKQFGEDFDSSTFVSRLMLAPDKSFAALMNLSAAVNALSIDEQRRIEIDKSLVVLGDTLGACERIFTAPVPLVYTRHTARFLGVWMLLLPFAMYEDFAKASALALPLVPASAMLALFMFGIEELSVQLEEPFSILPMQRFCDGILRAGKGLRDWSVESRAINKQKEKATTLVE